MKKLLLAVIILQSTIIFCQSVQKDFPVLKGPYLGQKPPGMMPELFAPGIVSTGNNEHSSPVFTSDLKEMYWSTIIVKNEEFVAKPTYYMKQVNGIWSRPEVPSFAKKFPYCENPFISPDGKKLFFAVSKSLSFSEFELYYVNRIGEKWSEPIKMEAPFNTPGSGEWQLTISENGTIFFLKLFDKEQTIYGIYKTIFENGKYQKPVLINNLTKSFSPYIAPDESYLIFTLIRENGYGSGDLYICFKQKDGAWGEAINMGNKVNTDKNERLPNVSPDGKYLFFNRMPMKGKKGDFKDGPENGWGDVYWVDAKIIEELKQKVNSQ